MALYFTGHDLRGTQETFSEMPFESHIVVKREPLYRFEKTYWVPAKAKNRKEMVPTNSPMTATVCPRVVGGSVRRSRRTTLSVGAVVGASVFMVEEAGAAYGRKIDEWREA